MIKFIFFDVGGVVVDDFTGNNKWEEMKEFMGVREGVEKEFDELYDKYELKDLCLSRNVDSLMPLFSKKFGIHFPKNFSMLDYFVEHLYINHHIWPIIKKAKCNFRIGLLTNMYVDMFEKIRKNKLLPPIDWDIIIDSSIVGLQKPDPKIFALSEDKCGVKGEEILFIDNSKENIKSADKFGWNTFLYDSTNHQKSCTELDKFIKNIH